MGARLFYQGVTLISWALCAQDFHVFYVLVQPQFSSFVCSPSSVFKQEHSAWRSLIPEGMWDVCGCRRASAALSATAVGCQSSPSHSSLSSSISIQPGGSTLPISNLQRVLLASHVCFLFPFSIQDANGRWFFLFLVSRSSHWSLSAIQPLKPVRLITSTF